MNVIIVTALIVTLSLALLILWQVFLKEEEEVEEVPNLKINTTLGVKGDKPVKVRVEPAGKGVVALVGGEYWVGFFVPEATAAGAGQTKKWLKEIREHMNDKFNDEMEIFDIASNIGFIQGYDGFWIRMRVGGDEKATEAIDRFLHEVQSRGKETRECPIMTAVAGMYIWGETIIPTRKVKGSITGEKKQEDEGTPPGKPPGKPERDIL